jgi:hypothetical protein
VASQEGVAVQMSALERSELTRNAFTECLQIYFSKTAGLIQNLDSQHLSIFESQSEICFRARTWFRGSVGDPTCRKPSEEVWNYLSNYFKSNSRIDFSSYR